MATPTVYLVSGANRGIGLAIVKALATQSGTIVFAGARTPNTAADLAELVDQYPGKVHILKLTSCDREDNDAAVKEIERVADRLDVVIANAGISAYYGPALTTPEDQMREHFNINVVGTHVLFQATYPLLSASTSSPKFIPISSGAGSITLGPSFPAGILAYGTSKAAENYLARKLHFEHPELICFPINPAAVLTDMAKSAIEKDPVMKQALVTTVTPEESATLLLKLVDDSTRDKYGGKFLNYDGETIEW